VNSLQRGYELARPTQNFWIIAVSVEARSSRSCLCAQPCYDFGMTAALKNIAETVERLPAKDIPHRDEVRSGKAKAVPASQVYSQIERQLAK
jgi:hypothetical protein